MTPLVELKDVVKKYRGETAREAAVDGVSFSCRQGKILALLGPNGAGKSTCIDMIAGLKSPTAGTVTTLGVNPYVSRRVVQTGVGVQPQHADLFDNITVQEVFELWSSLYEKAATTRQMLEVLNLEPSAKMRLKKLSGGQRQRVLVGLALVSRPRLLVLDEPTSGLDPNAREDLWGIIKMHRDDGMTILLSTHNMEEAEQVADDVVILSEGVVVANGTVGGLVAEYGRSDTVTLLVPAGVPTDVIAAIPGVLRVEVEKTGDQSRVTLITRTDEFRISDVLSTLPVKSVNMSEGSLATVFSRVTRSAPVETHLSRTQP